MSPGCIIYCLYFLLVSVVLVCCLSSAQGQTAPVPDVVGMPSSGTIPPTSLTNDLQAPKDFRLWEGRVKQRLTPSKRKINGNFIVGYEWGFPQSLDNLRNNAGQTILQGSLNGELLGIPLKIDGQFLSSTPRPALQNFVRFEFDKSAWLDSQREALHAKKEAIGNMREGYIHRIQEIEVKEAYYNSLEINDNPLSKAGKTKRGLPFLDSPALDTEIPQTGGLDSISGWNPKKPDHAQRFIARQKLRKDKAALQDSIVSLDNYSQMLDSLDAGRTPQKEVPYSRMSAWLRTVERFQVGQTTPDFSALMIGRIPVNGICLQTRSEKRDFSFVHGQLVSDVFRLTDRRDGWLREITNDVLPVAGNIGNRITSGQVSVWKDGESYLNFGVLYGIDKWRDVDSSEQPGQRGMQGANGVAELEGRVKLGRGQFLDIAYAQSTYQTVGFREKLSDDRDLRPANSAVVGRWTLDIPDRKASFFAEGRIVGGGFTSLGNPFLREDQARLNTGAKLKWKKVDLSLSNRIQKSNISYRLPITHRVSSWIVRSTYKVNKNWHVTGVAAPMRITVTNEPESSTNTLTGYTLIGMASHNIMGTNSFHVISFNLSTSSTGGTDYAAQFHDASVSINSELPRRTTLNAILRYNLSEVTDSTWSGESLISEISFGYAWKKGHSLRVGTGVQRSGAAALRAGGLLHLSAKLTKHLTFQLVAERVLMEDYLSIHLMDWYRRNPYRCLATLNLEIQ